GSTRDWSSDVCSSDLAALARVLTRDGNHEVIAVGDDLSTGDTHAVDTGLKDAACLLQLIGGRPLPLRGQGYSRATLQVNAEFRRGGLIAGGEDKSVNGEENDEKY